MVKNKLNREVKYTTKDKAIEAIRKDIVDGFYCLADELFGNREVIIEAVQSFGSVLGKASDDLRGDRDIVLQAVRQDACALQYAESGLKGDRDFVLQVVCKNPRSLTFAAEELQGDFDFLVEVCAAEPRCLDYVKDELKERIREESEVVARIGSDLEQNSKELDSECKFYFVTRETFLTQSTWPMFQDLQKKDLLVEESIRLADGVRGKYSKHIVSISHCWETPSVPDPTGAQLKAAQQYLNDHPHIQLVWGDYSSMPQGNRTPREKLEFKRMLPRVNLLYLSTRVVQIVDIAYPCRFWTQFESWLAMQKCTPAGLRGAMDARDVRFCIKCIHSADEEYEGAKLIKTWRNANAELAYKDLSAADVRVTNLSDKEAQLPKIKLLDKAVADAFKQPSELPDPVVEPDKKMENVPAEAGRRWSISSLRCGGRGEEAELTGDHKTELKELKEENTVLKKDNEILRSENTMLRESAIGGNALNAVRAAKNEGRPRHRKLPAALQWQAVDPKLNKEEVSESMDGAIEG